MLRLLVIASVLTLTAAAVAQPADPPPPEDGADKAPADSGANAPADAADTGEPNHTSASVEGAPKPGDANNMAVGPEHKNEGLLWIPRILLFPLRAVVEVVDLPIRGGLYAYEVYQLGPRAKSIFFNEEGTAGLFPVALVETGFGLNIGGRLVLRELGGSDFGFTGRASFGGRFRQIYSVSVSSGETWKRVELDLAARFESRPKDFFFGIGNGDLEDDAINMPLDPLDGESREARFQQDVITVQGGVAFRPMPKLRLFVSGAYNRRRFDDAAAKDSDDPLSASFDPMLVTGFEEGTDSLYGEVELTLDTRRSPSRWEGQSTPSTGWMLQGFAGLARGIGDDDVTDYIRYGFDAQYLVRIAEAPRVLALRLLLEGVTGDYNEVSFYDLPRLGGPLLLRGFQRDRFRDRVVGLGSAEYQFDLVTMLGGFLFVDVGRAFSDIDEVEPRELRFGFGGGLQIHSQTSFLGRLALTGSEDGFFATLSFDPVYDTRARVERR